MCTKTHAKNQTSQTTVIFIKLGLLLLTVFPITSGERCHGQDQWCQAPILSDLPLNYNQQPRYDTSGNIVDAHDGMLVQFGNLFYLYGTAYGRTGGFCDSNRYACYYSADLVQWTLTNSDLLPGHVSGLYFRPHVIYNSGNNQYVMWYNYWPDGSAGYLRIATSSSPAGPFTLLPPQNQPNLDVADFNLFVDNDPNRTAYIIYSVFPGEQILIQQLSTTDYQSLVGSAAAPGFSGEATILFKKDTTYYAMFGDQCCFCPEDSVCNVYECQQSSGTPISGTWNPAPTLNINNGFVLAQPDHVAKISTSLGGDRYFWMGDLWNGGPPLGPNWNRSDGCFYCAQAPGPDRGTNQQYWSAPLEFVSGHIQPLGKAIYGGSGPPTIAITNASGQPWGDGIQVTAISVDGSQTFTWSHPSSLAAGEGWTLDLSQLTSGTEYNLALADVYLGNTVTVIQSTKSFIKSSTTTISGYLFRIGAGGYYGGGYWGWYAQWDAPRTLDLVNMAGQPWGDARQVIATSGTSTVVLDYRTATWNAGEEWSIDLSPLTPGTSYAIALQDIYNRSTNTVGGTRSIIAGQPLNGYVYRPGGGGYAGWFTVWDGLPSTLSLFNDSTQTFPDDTRIVAYLNDTGSPIVLGSRTGAWNSTVTWTVPLSPLTVGCSYTFELQDTSNGNTVIPPRSSLVPIVSGEALGSGGYIYQNGGWYTYWGW